MRTRAPQTGSPPESAAYLDHLLALGEELSAAMEAVGANALERFEESLWRQEVLCAGLRRLGGEMDHASPAQGQAMRSGLREEGLGERIRRAGDSLGELNRRYAALIEHSSESARLFAGLCRSYRSPYGGAGGGTAGETRLSCDS